MAVINVDDAYILNETGQEVDKVTGLYTKNEDATDAEKEMARANISAGSTNPNLLDNPWFTVNQRGFTSNTNTNGVFSVDRWYINSGNGTQTLTSNGIELNNTNGTNYCSLQQAFGKDELAGRTVTMSVWTSDGIYTRTKVIPAQTSSVQSITTDFITTGLRLNFYVQVSSANASYLWQLYVPVGYSQTIRAVKLELGSVSTLANDAPPDYGTELAKCQYYFRRVKGDVYLCSGMVVNATSVVFPFPFTMYKKPNVSMSGTILAASNGGLITMTAIQSVGRAENAIQVRFTTSGATPYAAALLTPQNGGYIDLSADL